MGNILYAPKCDPPPKGSLMNLSDECMGRINRRGAPPSKATLKKDLPLEEEYMFRRLRCSDDHHSQINKLDLDGFNALADKIEDRINDIVEVPCSKVKLITCLTKNQNCLITCRKELEEFVDCVDEFRITRVKDRYQKELMNKRLEAAENKK